MKDIILASVSPRRKQLLEQLGLRFTVAPSGYEEVMDTTLSPSILAQNLSIGKAQKVASSYKNAIIIAADSFVVCDGKYMGKPHTKKEAQDMLTFLSNKTHVFITGFTILDSNSKKIITDSVETRVKVRELNIDEIDAYIQTNEPFEKAGGYAISEKGAVLIERIEGDYCNILGLPLYAVSVVLEKFGIKIL